MSGAVHNLGVEEVTIDKPANGDARCGLIAGRLVREALFVNGAMENPAGQMLHCYSAKNAINADYGGCLLGEMAEGTTLSHCHEFKNKLQGDYAASLASQIHSSATVVCCFSGTDSRMATGEATWLLNDQSPFDATWFQDLNKDGHSDAYPVLNNASARVYHKDQIYSNEPMGELFDLAGKGLKDDPFLIGSLADLQKVADYCNKGSKSTAIYFLQTADIDFQGANFRITNCFDGHYDGGGHTIRNGNIATVGPLGIFAYVSGTVTRLCVENTIVRGINGGARAGAIAGRLQGNGVISNCLVKDCDVSVNSDVWGVAGAIVGDVLHQGNVKSCLAIHNNVKASDNWYGEICGATENEAKIERCYTDGSLLVGSARCQGTFPNCFPGQTAALLKDGSVTYGLNGGDNPEPAWFQNINMGSNRDDMPVLSSDHGMVFKIGGTYTNDGEQLGQLGKGTAQDPYKIGSPSDLRKLIISVGQMKRSNFYVRQTADIDMKDSLMYPIGTGTRGFEGHYDGGGHVIRNAKMSNYQGEAMGLFNNILGVVEVRGRGFCHPRGSHCRQAERQGSAAQLLCQGEQDRLPEHSRSRRRSLGGRAG